MTDAAASSPAAPAVPATPDDLRLVDAWWRAANYLTVGQIYLRDNAMLERPIARDDIKPRLLGHWGTSPALSLVYAHLNRVIRRDDRDLLYVCGPGHGGPAMVANTWLERTYSELFPKVPLDRDGMKELFRQFSFPGGIPSHAAPETPGSINEGGELGYSLSHAYGAVLDDPDLVAVCVIGDGEAETGPLATSWHANKLLDAVHDGAVLPILNLNGYKIANPTILARIPEGELLELFRGYGYQPIVVSGGFDGEDPMVVHAQMAAALDEAFGRIDQIQQEARSGESTERPRWPMIVLRTPKGWTGPKVVDGKKVEGTWRAHQVPLSGVRENDEHREQLDAWMRSYGADELFDETGAPAAFLDELRPRGEKRMSAIPASNGGLVRRPLSLTDYRSHAVETSDDRRTTAEATRVLGRWLADVVRDNPATFRLFGPDETVSNRLDPVFDVTDRVWAARIDEEDEHVAHSGRVMEVLSEHLLQGLMEGYLLTGRHGLLNTYEAFVHIVDSMFNQHAKWLESADDIAWREPISSFTYLLSSHVWRQDHNGFSHQDPGFLDVVVNKQAHLVRIYLAPDANTLLAVADHALRTTDTVNVIVAGKQESPAWLSLPEAEAHVAAGAGIWEWAGTEGTAVDGVDPDVVLACAGDVPTLETVAAADILRQRLPDLVTRVVNVVDLMRLQDADEHSHGLASDDFDALFTTTRPVIFDFHGYPTLVHRLTYRRTNHDGIHVRGFQEKGTTTTPFDMAMLNDIDRYRLVLDVLHRVPGLADAHPDLVTEFEAKREEARAYAYEHGEDLPEVVEWEFGR
ncbi:phosphoketolase [Frigoribacterium sp. VKM Ac-2530]|uniref:phosphoketolase family protein n=1 Tax=Frigoribacterium sp. VKM Ac-2530 TaxID=2783822 RepID=UPI00188CDEA5|nr:phosphoketolase family protein [Frigoribacterium sp. VKM Ac-2530]MBF4579774.1 phosphoketolase family protein [Frigoribacterium sp. VKM Ac-2530]